MIGIGLPREDKYLKTLFISFVLPQKIFELSLTWDNSKQSIKKDFYTEKIWLINPEEKRVYLSSEKRKDTIFYTYDKFY